MFLKVDPVADCLGTPAGTPLANFLENPQSNHPVSIAAVPTQKEPISLD